MSCGFVHTYLHETAVRCVRNRRWVCVNAGLAGLDGGQGEEFSAGGADLDVGAHGRADAAVEARGPAAVVEFLFGQGVLPVVPQPLLVQARVAVVPREDLVLGAFAGGEPGQAHAERLQLGGRRGRPALVREVLAPAVEAAALAPDALDDPADPAVTAGQEAFDQARFAVVVTHADVAAQAAVGVHRVPQLAQPAVHRVRVALGGPLERRVRLGHEAADRDRAADVLAATGLPARADDLLRHRRDLQHVVVGLGRQAAHEVQLHLAPAVGVRGAHRPDQVLFGHRLVDHAADALAAALRGEGQAGTPAVAGQLVGQVDVERVDARRRQ